MFFYPKIRLLVAHELIDLSIYSPRNGRIHEQDERNGFVGMPLSTPIWILSNLKYAVQDLFRIDFHQYEGKLGIPNQKLFRKYRLLAKAIYFLVLSMLVLFS